MVSGWVDRVRAGHTPEVVLELLLQHYDPMYAASIRRNFVQYGQARVQTLADRSGASMQAAARELLGLPG